MSDEPFLSVIPYIFEREYDGNGLCIYWGFAISGSATSESKWFIMKFSYDSNGNVTKRQYASSLPKFGYVWDDRSSYNYG